MSCPENPDRYVTVTTTVRTEADATELARRLVDSRLAACAQYWPIRSVYRWHGKVETEPEFLVQLKTTAQLSESLKALIRDLHTYDVPQITIAPIKGGLEAYLEWIEDETLSDEQGTS